MSAKKWQHATFAPSFVEDAPAPGTPEWAQIITASKVPVILGLSPWDSPYSLWCKATGRIPAGGPSTAATERGDALEDALLAWLGSKLDGHRVRPGRTCQSPQRPTDQATPDGFVFEGRRRTPWALVECKTAARGDEWGRSNVPDPAALDADTIEHLNAPVIPAAYLAQCAWQMWVTGAGLVFVPALVAMELRLFVVRRADVEDALPDIVRQAAAFERLIVEDKAPDWDGADATWQAVRAVHEGIDADAVATVSTADAVELHDADAAVKSATERLNLARSRVMSATGEARTVEDEDGQKVAIRVPTRGAPTLRLTKNYTPAAADLAA